ncbi:hypothetical protein BK146_12305 [Paenibacillus sp. FSL R7-0333]|nr:hypothetical protein BK146_12305 [Paenibacillus sp. FSL R7-0333]
MVTATAKVFRGKIVDLAEYSRCHRTSLGHFLTEGKRDESVLQHRVNVEALAQVREISERTIERIGFHHSHLLGKFVFGYQLQATVVACSDVSLIHSIDLYDKTQKNQDGKVVTKIDGVCDLAKTLWSILGLPALA